MASGFVNLHRRLGRFRCSRHDSRVETCRLEPLHGPPCGRMAPVLGHQPPALRIAARSAGKHHRHLARTGPRRCAMPLRRRTPLPEARLPRYGADPDAPAQDRLYIPKLHQKVSLWCQKEDCFGQPRNIHVSQSQRTERPARTQAISTPGDRILMRDSVEIIPNESITIIISDGGFLMISRVQDQI